MRNPRFKDLALKAQNALATSRITQKPENFFQVVPILSPFQTFEKRILKLFLKFFSLDKIPIALD